MSIDAAIDRVVDQRSIDRLAETLAPAVRQFLTDLDGGSGFKDFLHGVWLGHPLHPVLTDIPLGAWTTAIVLDTAEASGRRELGPGADAAVAVGLVGAVGAAVSGLADWSETGGRARRTGLVHALMNVTATGLFAGSWLARKRDRPAGRCLALAGYSVSLAAAYLGGKLVYDQQIGVDHTVDQTVPDDFVAVMNAAELANGQMRKVEVTGTAVLVVKENDQCHALAERCAHLGGPLAEGTLENGTLTCPWHASQYAVDDGRVLRGPSTHPQPSFEVRVTNGVVEVRSNQS